MRGFAGNVLRAGVGIFGSTMLGLAIQVAIARGLGVEAFGLYGFGLAYVALWQVVMDGGSGVLATREARGSRAGSLEALIAVKPALLAAGYAGLLAVAWAAGLGPAARRVVAVLGVQAAGLATLTFAASIFRGHEEFGTESLHLIAQRVLFGLFVGAVLLTGRGVLWVSAAGAVSYVAVSLVAVALVARRHGVRIRFHALSVRAHRRALARALGPLMLAGDLAITTIDAVLVLALIAVGRERAYAVALAFAAAVNVTANLALTPRLGAYGSAWAAVAGDATLLAGCLLALRRLITGFLPVREWAVLGAGGALAFGALLAVKQASVAAAASLTVAARLVCFETMSPLGFRVVLVLRTGAAGAFDRAEV